MQYRSPGDDAVVSRKSPAHVVIMCLSNLVADGHPDAALYIGERLMKRHTGGLTCAEPFWFWMARAAEDLGLPVATAYWQRADQSNPHWANRKSEAVV